MSRALPLALLAVGAEAAYDCNHASMGHPAYKLRTDASTTYCGGLMDPCSPEKCCVDDTTKCGNPSTVQWCSDAAKTFTAGATGTDEATCCVVDKAKCDTFTGCSAGTKLKDNAASMYCSGATCQEYDAGLCCTLDPDTCLGKKGADGACGADKYLPTSKYGTAASGSDAEIIEACCEPTTTTTTTTAKCSAFDCGFTETNLGVTDVFREADPAKANEIIYSTEDSEKKAGKCCKVKAKWCYNHIATLTCSGTNKVVNPVLEGSTEAACCVDDKTCSTFDMTIFEDTPQGSISGAASLKFAPVLFVMTAFVCSRSF